MSPPGEDFTAVLRTADAALGRYRHVVVVLLDAFGWRFLQRHAEHPLLRRLARDGTVRALPSQFPSTTAAHVTTMHSDLGVGEHGIYEWRIWEPALGRVISPLLYSYAGDRERDTLAPTGLAMGDVLPVHTRYERLAQEGVASIVAQPAAFSPSTYDRAATRGALLAPWPDLAAGLEDLLRRAAAHEHCYAYLYTDAIDTTGHLHGPSSRAFDDVVTATLNAVHAAFFGPRAPRLDDALLVLTADHGQVDVSPERVDVLDELWPGLPGALAPDATGAPTPPAGSARDVFLHVAPERVDEAVAALAAALGDRGTVHRTADLVAAGRFGAAGPRLLERVAPVCVLPGPGRMAWTRAHEGIERRFLGHHGGLHPDEAQTFVATIPLA
ncbi:alkaline phosphatase family protein [Baekduia soli]|uniref:Alkaline phosphatase family protein n=1 Tax=Baekduia soli TaxID=496014 RepID=A0A5B8UB98_9ACTN|nr:alkaline phosphatase family protein [Baekduia soli]QEC50463.1 alkaline phosphatase family protein [Baekduia soli]